MFLLLFGKQTTEWGTLMSQKKSLEIIRKLRQDARSSLAQLSREMNIPVSTIHDWVKSFENKTIKRYTTLLDFRKLGFNSRAYIALKTEMDTRELLQQFLQDHSNVNSIYIINHQFDFLIEVIFKHIVELKNFIETLETDFKITNKEIFDISNEVQKENFLTKPSI